MKREKRKKNEKRKKKENETYRWIQDDWVYTNVYDMQKWPLISDVFGRAHPDMIEMHVISYCYNNIGK
jgi:hypothetical protein